MRPALACLIHVERARGASPAWLGRGAVWLPDLERALPFERLPPADDAQRETSARARAAAEGRAAVCWSAGTLLEWRRMLHAHRLDPWTGEAVPLGRLAVLALGASAEPLDPAALAGALGLPPPDPEAPGAVARFLWSGLEALLDRLPRAPRDPERLRMWLAAKQPRVDFARFDFGRELLDRLPSGPGVYVMRDRAGEPLYVGKARNLSRRVRSYFAPGGLGDPKIARIHADLRAVEWLAAESEVEALLLEMKLIRELRPPVNVQSEVREGAGGYGRDRNLILLVPAAGEAVSVYLLSQGTFVGRRRARLGRPPGRALLERVRATYFPPPGGRARRPRPAWEAALVSRWLAANRRRLNVIDVDEAGGFEAVAVLLARFLRDPDRLARKVYYR